MRKLVVPIILLLLTIFQAYGQSGLYIPKEIRSAYQAKTRSPGGSPGADYFQNTADYNIDAEFDPVGGVLFGNSSIIYKNNSSFDLQKIVFKLYPNLYKKGAARNFNIEAADVGNGMNIISLIGIDDSIRNIVIKDKLLIVSLAKPLLPGESIGFVCEWSYQFPMETLIREGRYLDSTFFVAYWYPRIAVFDDIDGWDTHQYNGEQEFYNDFGDYSVRIRVPDNYLVWASGELKNPSEVYSDTLLNILETAYSSDEVANIITKENVGDNIFARNDRNIWEFSSVNITDFAFCLSNNFLWDATSVKIANKRVKIDAVYKPGSLDFQEVAHLSAQSLRLLSRRIGINYPYPRLTAFNGHYGMEFPMMINDGDAINPNETIFITAHEIAHTWFPFLVGINEHRYAFMDEGLVTYLPKTVEDQLSEDSAYRSMLSILKKYSFYGGSDIDLPMMVPSEQLTGKTYMYVSYNRSAIAYYILNDMLGDKTFNKCIYRFIKDWSGKHPTAYDMFYTFNKVSGKNLDWFWEKWFFSFGMADIGIKGFSQKKNIVTIDIENTGGLPSPIFLTLGFEDGSIEKLHKNAFIWAKGDKELSFGFKTDKKVASIEIDDSYSPDANKSNNFLSK